MGHKQNGKGAEDSEFRKLEINVHEKNNEWHMDIYSGQAGMCVCACYEPKNNFQPTAKTDSLSKDGGTKGKTIGKVEHTIQWQKICFSFRSGLTASYTLTRCDCVPC